MTLSVLNLIMIHIKHLKISIWNNNCKQACWIWVGMSYCHWLSWKSHYDYYSEASDERQLSGVRGDKNPGTRCGNRRTIAVVVRTMNAAEEESNSRPLIVGGVVELY